MSCVLKISKNINVPINVPNLACYKEFPPLEYLKISELGTFMGTSMGTSMEMGKYEKIKKLRTLKYIDKINYTQLKSIYETKLKTYKNMLWVEKIYNTAFLKLYAHQLSNTLTLYYIRIYFPFYENAPIRTVYYVAIQDINNNPLYFAFVNNIVDIYLGNISYLHNLNKSNITYNTSFTDTIDNTLKGGFKLDPIDSKSCGILFDDPTYKSVQKILLKNMRDYANVSIYTILCTVHPKFLKHHIQRNIDGISTEHFKATNDIIYKYDLFAIPKILRILKSKHYNNSDIYIMDSNGMSYPTRYNYKIDIISTPLDDKLNATIQTITDKKDEIKSVNITYKNEESECIKYIEINNESRLTLKTDLMSKPDKYNYGYKAALTLDGKKCIIKLLIPSDSKIISSLKDTKCRTDYCIPIRIVKYDLVDDAFVLKNDFIEIAENFVYKNKITYKINEPIRIPDFDLTNDEVCLPGVHFHVLVNEIFRWHGFEYSRDIKNLEFFDNFISLNDISDSEQVKAAWDIEDLDIFKMEAE